MNSIIIGTTPKIKYTFHIVAASDIEKAVLTIKKGSAILLERDIDTAVVEEDAISWELTQEETLDIGVGFAKVMLNWVLQDGTRGASRECEIQFKDNQKREVI